MSEPGVIGDIRQLPPKVYLGDAVYARVDEFGAVILTTENGYRATNIITLEPEIMRALLAWYAGLKEPAPAPETKDYCAACADGRCAEHPQYNTVAVKVERIPLCAECGVVPGWGECSSRFCYGCCADAKHDCDKTCSDDPPAGPD
jgi:hypothetical protein